MAVGNEGEQRCGKGWNEGERAVEQSDPRGTMGNGRDVREGTRSAARAGHGAGTNPRPATERGGAERVPVRNLFRVNGFHGLSRIPAAELQLDRARNGGPRNVPTPWNCLRGSPGPDPGNQELPSTFAKVPPPDKGYKGMVN